MVVVHCLNSYRTCSLLELHPRETCFMSWFPQRHGLVNDLRNLLRTKKKRCMCSALGVRAHGFGFILRKRYYENGSSCCYRPLVATMRFAVAAAALLIFAVVAIMSFGKDPRNMYTPVYMPTRTSGQVQYVQPAYVHPTPYLQPGERARDHLISHHLMVRYI